MLGHGKKRAARCPRELGVIPLAIEFRRDPLRSRNPAERVQARIGSWHDEPVGPHPVAMYQVAFAIEEFSRLVPWLMLNRDGLNVLVHPLSGDSVADHTRFALWLGAPLPLRLEVLRRGPGRG